MSTVLVTAFCPVMFNRHSLRHRVALGFALLSLLVVAAHSLALYFIIEDREEEQINRVVDEEMEAFLARYRDNPVTAAPRSQFLSAYVARNAAEQEGLPVYLRKLAIGTHEVYFNGDERHVSVRRQGQAFFYLVYDVAQHDLQMRELIWILGFGLAVTAVLSGLLGMFLSRHLTQPVSDLAARVSALGPEQPATALLASLYSDQEVRQLAEAFDAYAVRVREFVSREQAFTADVSHELRTPLTAIRTGCELLLAGAPLSADQRGRIERIDRSAERMTAVLQSMLLLARQQDAMVRETVSLRDCANDVAEPLRERFAATGVAWRNEIPAGVNRHLDRAALEIVLSNLLRNALDNTESGHVVLRMSDSTLEIEDTGRGIAARDLPRVFERHYRGEDARAHEGHGIGLALVKRIAERHGWMLTLESRPGEGTRVRLILPPA